MKRLALAYIFAFIVFAVVTPFLPLLIRGLGYSPLFVGLLLGLFEGAGIAGPFAFGYFADRSGNYKIPQTIGYAAVALSVIPLALFVRPLASVAFIIIFAFCFRATTPLLDAAATVQLGAKGDYGKIRAAGSVSFIAMALFMQWLRPETPFAIAFWISVTSAATIVPVLLLKNNTTISHEPHERNNKIDDDRKAPASIWTKSFIAGFAIIFLCRLAMAPIYTFFPLYLTEELSWNVVGAMFALATACEVPCMFFSARLVRRWGPLPLLALSAAGIAVRLFVYALFPSKAAIVCAQLLHTLCFGIFHPAAVAFIAQSVPPEKRAVGMSLYLSLGSGLPQLLGNVLGGAVVEYGGYAAMFALFGFFALAGVGVFWRVRRLSGTPLHNRGTTPLQEPRRR